MTGLPVKAGSALEPPRNGMGTRGYRIDSDHGPTRASGAGQPLRAIRTQFALRRDMPVQGLSGDAQFLTERAHVGFGLPIRRAAGTSACRTRKRTWARGWCASCANRSA